MSETPDLEAIRARLGMYQARLQEGDGDGSLVGALYIIAKSGFSDIASLLAALAAAEAVVEAAKHYRWADSDLNQDFIVFEDAQTDLWAKLDAYQAVKPT